MDTGYPALIPEPDPNDFRKKDEGPKKKANDVEVRHPALGHDGPHEEA